MTPNDILEMFTPRIVIVENDENDAIILSRVLQHVGTGVQIHWVSSIDAFVKYARTEQLDLIISDYNLHNSSALNVLELVQQDYPGLPVIVVSHMIGEKAAVEVMKAGAKDVVNKVDYKHLTATVSKELIALRHIRERTQLRTEINNIDMERQALAKALEKVRDAEARANSLLSQLNKVFESSPDGIRVIDKDFNVLRVNANYLKFTACSENESCEGKCYDFTPREWCNTNHCALKRALGGETKIEDQIQLTGSDGDERQYVLSVSALIGQHGEVDGIVENLKDVTQWQQMQRQILHAQKMESIGQLAAGIAHEINTPTQFVGDNISFLKEGFSELVNLLNQYEATIEQVRNGEMNDALWQPLDDAKENADLDYLKEEIPQALAQSEDGIGRISSIVKAMKEFSHPGSEDAELFSVNQNIQNTVTVARNEWKYVSRVELEFGFKLPLVRGYPGEFNQTILNMIVNAAHAIEAKSSENQNWKGTISVKTYQRNGNVVVEIKDNAIGIPEDIQNRIFDPFFTTKGVGKGT
ncbi:MAG: response regulator [Deltaproteobacteria bacterium]|nr:response regulator [Deltaproteobacteria bacterium]